MFPEPSVYHAVSVSRSTCRQVNNSRGQCKGPATGFSRTERRPLTATPLHYTNKLPQRVNFYTSSNFRYNIYDTNDSVLTTSANRIAILLLSLSSFCSDSGERLVRVRYFYYTPPCFNFLEMGLRPHRQRRLGARIPWAPYFRCTIRIAQCFRFTIPLVQYFRCTIPLVQHFLSEMMSFLNSTPGKTH